MPRSGTTLLSTILNRHPDLAIAPETHFFKRLRNLMENRGLYLLESEVRSQVEAYLRSEEIRDFGLSAEVLQCVATDLGIKPFEPKRLFSRLLIEYAKAANKPRFGEKTPSHLENVETLRSWFPSSQFVCIVRDPRDVVASLTYVPWNNKSHIDNAIRWTSYANTAMSLCSDSSWRGRFTAIRYEDLVSTPSQAIRSICGFLGVDYSGTLIDPAARDGRANFSPAREPWKQTAAQSITASNVGKWRKTLTSVEAAMVESISKKAMHEFDYRREALTTIGWREWTKIKLTVIALRRKMITRPTAKRLGRFARSARRRVQRIIETVLRAFSSGSKRDKP